ncbi:hypothetical protein K1T73_10000 [Roseovarius sp. SCSIO 43702]|uniref:hypothetical protein n=1 Tax=Roseovarius sp. SCSIO 43702 TaxID=2823043 RepID=UPI001C72DB9E|nr:hypothetical protein [Roseovarius sp. SCSIO 43702]QYX55442.1 hypothetical protein K1T73_10000 [Roseovarius sp. SCSIO 43702]
MTPRSLHARLIAAHDPVNKPALVKLYTEAADTANNLDASCFFLTHAYVFALDAGHPDAPRLYARLKAHGREA